VVGESVSVQAIRGDEVSVTLLLPFNVVVAAITRPVTTNVEPFPVNATAPERAYTSPLSESLALPVTLMAEALFGSA
jgi:hypothetical protein